MEVIAPPVSLALVTVRRQAVSEAAVLMGRLANGPFARGNIHPHTGVSNAIVHTERLKLRGCSRVREGSLGTGGR